MKNLSLHQILIVGSLNIVKVFLLIPVLISYLIYNILHYSKIKKDPSQHIVKGWQSTVSGNMVHSFYDSNCSCGKKETPRNFLEIPTKVFMDSITLLRFY